MKQMHNEAQSPVDDLVQALLLCQTKEEMIRFLKDVCTPGEVADLAERWRVAQIVHAGELSYREIQEKTGASLGTIVRVARFLKDEPIQGYTTIIDKLTKKRKQQ